MKNTQAEMAQNVRFVYRMKKLMDYGLDQDTAYDQAYDEVYGEDK